MSKERFDIRQHLTDRIVSAIEAGAGQWQMPWYRGSSCRHPVNIASGNEYRGVLQLLGGGPDERLRFAPVARQGG